MRNKEIKHDLKVISEPERHQIQRLQREKEPNTQLE